MGATLELGAAPGLAADRETQQQHSSHSASMAYAGIAQSCMRSAAGICSRDIEASITLRTT